MPIFKIPVNYVEVKDYEVERESLEQAVECLEDLLEVRVGIDHRITSINYKELLKRQLAESNKEKIVHLSYEDWFKEYAPIANPFTLTSKEILKTYQWEPYFFDAKDESNLYITGRTSLAYVWTVLKDSCNSDNPYKAVYRYFRANYDFEQDANCQDNEDDIIWSPYLSVAGYFIATKIPPTTPNTLFVNL